MQIEVACHNCKKLVKGTIQILYKKFLVIVMIDTQDNHKFKRIKGRGRWHIDESTCPEKKE